MEYLYVKYFRSRYVFLDGNRLGRTNKSLRVEAGSHRVDLGEVKNYAPEFHDIAISGTTQAFPMRVEFVYTGGMP
jgi:hypothetical protein